MEQVCLKTFFVAFYNNQNVNNSVKSKTALNHRKSGGLGCGGSERPAHGHRIGGLSLHAL